MLTDEEKDFNPQDMHAISMCAFFFNDNMRTSLYLLCLLPQSDPAHKL